MSGERFEAHVYPSGANASSAQLQVHSREERLHDSPGKMRRVTGGTRRAHATSSRPRGELAEEPPGATRGHTGSHGESDVDVRVQSAVLDADGVGRFLNVGRSTIYELHSNERLPAPIQVGRGLRWVKAEIEAWLLYGAPSRAVWERIWPKLRKEALRR